MTHSVSQAVSDVIEEKAVSNGHLTFDRLQGMFESHSETIDEKIRQIQESINNLRLPSSGTEANKGHVVADDSSLLPAGNEQRVQFTNPAGQVGTYRAYSYCYGSGLGWHVPKGFEFPVHCNLEVAWKLWLIGMPTYQVEEDGRTKTAPIRPFRKLDPKFLPQKAKTVYLLHWRPIFEFVEAAPDLTILEDPTSIDADYLQDSFLKVKMYLQTRVEYVFQKPRAKPLTWEVSTWSKHVTKSFIMRHGTENDKAHFPPEERVIRTRRESQKRKKPLHDRRRVRRRTNQDSARLIVEATNVLLQTAEETNDSSVAPENWQPDEMAAAQVLVEQSTTGTAAARVATEESLTGEDLEDFLEYARNLDAATLQRANANMQESWQVSPVVQQQRAVAPRIDTTPDGDDKDSSVSLCRRLDNM